MRPALIAMALAATQVTACRKQATPEYIGPVPSESHPAKPKSCPSGMVLIPGGTTEYEHWRPGSLEVVKSTVSLSAFCIDLTEVREDEYPRCGACAKPRCKGLEENLPVVCVAWPDAERFCREVRNGRLPSEAEWELAARGPTLFNYPWGPEDDPLNKSVCVARKAPCPVDETNDDISPYGVRGMGYGAEEWTRTCFDPPQCTSRIAAGRSFLWTARVGLRLARDAYPMNFSQDFLGFRCVSAPQ